MAPTPRKKGPGRWAVAVGGGLATAGFIAAIAAGGTAGTGAGAAQAADTPPVAAIQAPPLVAQGVATGRRAEHEGHHDDDDDDDGPRFSVTLPGGVQLGGGQAQTATGPRLRTRSS